MRRGARIRNALFAAISLVATYASAGTLADVFHDRRFAGLGLAPLGDVLASTVALTYPVASASASVTYEYDPALETLERRPGAEGPIFGERAETVGHGRVALSLGYSYVDLVSLDGHDLDALPSRRVVAGRFLTFPLSEGITLADGRRTNFLPVQVLADIRFTAHLITPSVTYGLTPDLDVNVSLPLLHTGLDLKARTRLPDPRFPSFRLPPGDPHAGTSVLSESAEATGPGDLLLRAKYLVHRGAPVDTAVALGLTVPTGREEDFQGAGSTRGHAALVLSRTFGTRAEALLNVGGDLDADDVARSLLRWAVGATARVGGDVTAAVVFLGRHEFEPRTRIAVPFFLQVRRADVYDASIGLRWRFAESGVLSANAIVPLNDDGLRAAVIPTVSVEYVLPGPRFGG